ncbi:UPF0755 protein [Pustulibacterium marinum]|uniref:Endolytic murein transglycosylase n=1 Tax=Pustulibacterium marinum TaxID=1224947 RepID=A0A1I7FNK5_9FLAO|nr:endolytic transglycosylase MltG [Pustulibacterium marinum]SFU37764.1 UPF0755 protein [Pustulibacterium marinum]
MNLKKLVAIVAVLGLVACSYFVYVIYSWLFVSNTNFNNEYAEIYIPTNATYADVKEQLTPLLKDVDAFRQVANKKGYTSNIKAGKYRIQKGMNNNQIVNTLRSGNIPVNVSFNNQDTAEKLAGRIAVQIEADSASLVTAMKDTDFLTENGFTEATYLSMYIPNTYEFFWNTDSEGFRNRMQKEYEKFWTADRKSKAAELNLSPTEVMTLASIVQKETAKTNERKRVAGVYLNRLKSGMLLQADPTVIYAVKDRNADFDTIIKRVVYEHLNVDSPYNTYKYAGLPPGPIAMPDISSIDAVLNPEKHDYYYFVADTKNFGYHKFSKTLAQHNRNAAKYHAWVSKQGY